MNDTTFAQLQPGAIGVFRVHYIDGIKKVLAENFDRTSIDGEGNNALHLVSMPKNAQKLSAIAIRLVITSGVSVNARNNFDFTPLMLAVLLLPADLVICGQDDSADRLLAAHPNANSNLLAKLSESRDDIVRKNVLAHKNTSQQTLQQMSDGHIRIHRLK